MMTLGAGLSLQMASSTSMPVPSGIRTSRMTTSGLDSRTDVMVSATSQAWPTISTLPVPLNNVINLLRIGAESSATKTLIFLWRSTSSVHLSVAGFSGNEHTQLTPGVLSARSRFACRTRAYSVVGVCLTRWAMRQGQGTTEEFGLQVRLTTLLRSADAEWHNESSPRWS